MSYASESLTQSYSIYRQILEQKHPFLSSYESFVTSVPLYVKPGYNIGLDSIAQLPPPQLVDIDFGQGPLRRVSLYPEVPFIQPGQAMEQLHRFLMDSKRVSLATHHVQSLLELKADVVVNCAGLGARKLAEDTQLSSYQGHLLMLQGQKQQDCQYQIVWPCNEEHVAESGHAVNRAFYFLPKKDLGTELEVVGLLGGTVVKGAGMEEPNAQEFEGVWNRARIFFGYEPGSMYD